MPWLAFASPLPWLASLRGGSDKYVNAFLNSRLPGTLLFGIDDAGVVRGLRLSRADRDAARQRLAHVMHKSFPSVESDLYHIEFLPVRGKCCVLCAYCE